MTSNFSALSGNVSSSFGDHMHSEQSNSSQDPSMSPTPGVELRTDDLNMGIVLEEPGKGMSFNVNLMLAKAAAEGREVQYIVDRGESYTILP